MPTYTLGRRQTAPLTDHEAGRLKAPLRIILPEKGDRPPSAPPVPTPAPLLPVAVLHSPRGGQTTYHGPGQAVLWPVLDLKSPDHKQFTVRCYSRLLEDTTISVLRSLFGLTAFTTEDPGVWVSLVSSNPQALRDPVKIAAMGVHLRRHVTALGTAINIAMPSADVLSEEMNPWARIVACGLEGKVVTSVAAEVDGGLPSLDNRLGGRVREEAVAASWAGELARRIGVDGVDAARQEDILALVTDILARSDDITPEEAEYVTGLQRLL
ncbi:putative octanoyltransferase [Podospora aff. communis PSN243]|uniref:lipoyl(octanoyl) transferase n=1 Tax=Podospora aff. communis PSN243 TaxID=3040156 RepID=A0AAV9GF84_9PEZI|nr:putative octanoyltransferase [Podospora aff. communis PSN243]